MPKPVYLSQLESISILWPGDVHIFAEFLLRSYRAVDRERKEESGRALALTLPTISGIASSFANVTRISASRVRDHFVDCGVELSATVSFDPESHMPDGEGTRTDSP